MPLITDPDTLARLRALNQAYLAAEEAKSAAASDVAEAAQRMRSLQQTIANHRAAEPTPDPDMSSELSQLLAANPAAANSADWSGRLLAAQDAQASALVAWKGKGTVLDQAIARVQEEHAERSALAERAAAIASAAYRAFGEATAWALLRDMTPRWEAFVRETIAPMEAFERYLPSGARSVVSFNDNGVALISLPGGAVSEWLYRKGQISQESARAAVEEFRSALVAAPSKSRARG